MKNTKSHPVDYHDAMSHFAGMVNADGRGLSSVISSLVAGRFFALAPMEASYSRLKDFRVGGLLPPDTQRDFASFVDVKGMPLVAVPVSTLAEEMAEIICKLSTEEPVATIFIREPYLTSRDDSDKLADLVSLDSALYKLISAKTCNAADLTRDIRAFQVSWSFLLILSGVNIQERDIHAIVSRAIAIVVGAYDGESYLYWVRSGAERGLNLLN